MRILGIETSCDETSAAVVEETGDAAKPWSIRSNIVASQVAIHREWGGVVPELASRQHIRDICGVVDRALSEAETAWEDLGAVAVTQGPGLVGSLLVGVSYAKAAAAAAGLPLVAVHHLAGHIESLVLQNGELPLPSVVLVVSGGHTSLYLVEQPGSYQLLSRTRDDAAGEAYDKVAKLLGLGYPGGPVIDRLAKTGDDRAIALPTTRLTHADRNAPELKGDLDFSFSGLKTAVLRESGVREGLCLVNAMHITASVYINDDEGGLLKDYDDFLEKLAPHEPTTAYRHNRTGEDNGDAHIKRQLMGREVVVAITNGKLDFGPWEQIFYGEFDGRRAKRVLIKVLGD